MARTTHNPLSQPACLRSRAWAMRDLWAGLTGERSPVRGESVFAQLAAMSRRVAPGAYLIGLVANIAARLAARCV